jgi:hypothetical protein
MSVRKRPSRGQFAVMFALALPALLAALGLCVDLSVIYLNWESLQKAADAGVLAGANSLPYDPAAATTTAKSYVQLNGVQKSEIVSTAVSADQYSITMTVTRSVPYYFARVVGLGSAPVTVSATAGVKQNTGEARGLIPLGLPCSPGNCSYTAGQTLSIKGGQNGSGNFLALALGGSGANTYRGNLQDGYSGSVSVGDMVTTQTGNLTGPTAQGLDPRITLGQQTDPSGTASSASDYDPRRVIVPMVDPTGINGNSQVPVTGFAVIWVDKLTGNNSTVSATFVETLPATTVGGSAPEQFGMIDPVLTR